MSETTLRVTGRINTTILPGYTLSQFEIEHFEQAEQEFANRHRAGVVKFAMSGQTVGVAELFVDAAERLIASGHFAYGGFAFDGNAKAPTSIPTLLWIALQAKHPAIDRGQAAALYRDHPDKPGVQRAILELMGYPVGQPKNAPAGKGTNAGGSTSDGGSTPSAALPPGSESPSSPANPG